MFGQYLINCRPMSGTPIIKIHIYISGVYTHKHIFRHHNHLLVLLGSIVTPFSADDSIFGGHIGFMYIRSSPII